MDNTLLQLTEDNYYSSQADMQYMSVSQFKDFAGTTANTSCEETALKKLKGQITTAPSTSMLVGSYVDAYFEGTLDAFKTEHPEIYKKTGDKGLLADYRQAEDIIRYIESDVLMTQFLSGQKQVIMTADLFGVPWKIKMDSYFPDDKIVDLKIMKDMEPLWSPLLHRKVDFAHFFGYDIQGAIYQKIVEIVTGKKLPFYLAVATKEKPADKAVIEITQDYLDEAYQFISDNIEHVLNVKNGVIAPARCGICGFCRLDKQLTAPIQLKDIMPVQYGNDDDAEEHGPYSLFDD